MTTTRNSNATMNYCSAFAFVAFATAAVGKLQGRLLLGWIDVHWVAHYYC